MAEGRADHGAPADGAAPQRLSARFYGRIALIGFGFFGVQLAFTTYNAFLPLLYEPLVEGWLAGVGDFPLGSRTVIGLLMGTDNLVGLMLIPVIGAWSDRTTGRLGRRLPFVLLALPAAALTFAGIPWAAATLWTLIAADVLFTAAIHAYRGPVISLMPDHTPPENRSTANGIVNLMGGLGTILALGGLSFLYDVDPRLAFGAGALVMVGTVPLILAGAERHPPHIEHESAGARPLRDTALGVVGLLRRARRGQLVILAAMACYFVGFAGLDAMFPLYGVNVLGLTGGEAARLVTLFPVTFMLFAIPAGVIGTRLGKVRAMQMGLVLLPALFLVAPALQQPWMLAVLFAIGGCGWALINVQGMPLVADLGGRSRVGFYIGMYYLFTMGGQMAGPTALGAPMDLVGDRGMFYAGAVAFAVALVLLTVGWRLLPADPVELARREEADAEGVGGGG